MNTQRILDKRDELATASGEWTAHNIQLAPGVFTLRDGPAGDDPKIRRITQIVADLSNVPFDEMRLLDLACLEGMYAVEFALRGAQVLGIEGQKDNPSKALMASETLGLSNLEFQLGDVRTVSPETHGQFDVILCLGILYHLDDPAVFDFVMKLGRMCRHLLVLDTHVALLPEEDISHDGDTYQGRRTVEHHRRSTEDEIRDR